VKIEIPKPQVREDGEYAAMVTKGYGDPHGTIALDDKWEVVLDYVSAEDCDALIRAAAEIKEKVLAYRAEMAAPHGTRHLYKGRCQLCGKPEDDELHAEPEPCPSVSEHAKVPCLEQGEHARHRNGMVVWGPGVTEPEPASVAS
jgi:hypothetical protein